MRTRPVLAALVLSLGCSAAATAGGPLIIFNPATRTPWAYTSTVDVFTDLGALGPVLTNAEADAVTAFAFGQWTAVASATFAHANAGDFGAVPLPDITGANAGLVIGPDNGGGIHVMYDNNGTIISSFLGAPPGVLGVASPEWGAAGALTESWAVMNGTAVDAGDPVGTFFAGVFTHEFGHAINLAHSQTNGARIYFGDAVGPASCALPYGGAPGFADIETMYPFIDPSAGSIGADVSTVDVLDDIASISNVNPGAGWPATLGRIHGTVYQSDGSTQITGVNVIARNLADPFGDCISALSGDFTQGALGDDGLYRFRGLTPGADYAVYIDGIVAGGFSTVPSGVPAGAEEFHNGVDESANPVTDDRCDHAAIGVSAGTIQTADVILNEPYLSLNDDNFVEVALPFPYEFCDVAYTSVFVNANGSVSFGAGDEDFSPTVAEFLSGVPRIAGVWADLSPQLGAVIANQVGADFVVSWLNVPEFGTQNSNTFSITLHPNGKATVDYGTVDVTTAIAGRSSGSASPNPPETNLGAAPQPITGEKVYENFAGDFDLDSLSLLYSVCGDSCTANQPPVAACHDTTIVADGGNPCPVPLTAADIDAGSYDPEDEQVFLSIVPAGPFGAGVHQVMLIIEDACGDADTCTAEVTVVCPGSPQKEVSPLSVTFLNVAPGDTVCQTVTVRNVGDADLDLDSITGCDAGNFYLDLAGVGASVAPGDSAQFDVCYTAAVPDTADDCEILIDTNDSTCTVSVQVGSVTAVFGDPGTAPPLTLAPVSPNPFRSATQIRFALREAQPVRLEVFDLAGRRVRTLLDGAVRGAGSHALRWDGADDRGVAVSAGIYLIRVVTPGESRMVRAVLTP